MTVQPKQKLFAAIVFHPVCFALFPILSLYSRNIKETRLVQVVIPVVVVVGATVALMLLGRLIFKNTAKVGILLSLTLALFFSYGYVFEEIVPLGVPRPALSLLAGSFVLFTVAAWLTIRTRRNLGILTSLLNAVGLGLVAITLVSIVSYEGRSLAGSRDYSHLPDLDPHTTTRPTSLPTQRPDIYCLIFDRYGNAKSVREFCGLDNGPFIAALRQRGFYVAEDARTNYPKTAHSLASSLNMDHLLFLRDDGIEPPNSFRPLSQMLRGKHRVARFLKAKGYRYIHLGTSYDPTAKNDSADLLIRYRWLSEFSQALYQTTALFPVVSQALHIDSRTTQYRSIQYAFEELANLPRQEGPIFVFAHILVPHGPYVFDADGSFLPRSKSLKRSEQENYANQVRFLNPKILDLIDTLQKSSKTPPVIILQADEGPHPLRYNPLTRKKGDTPFTWRNATDSEIRVKFGILNALFLPGIDTQKCLKADSTPVNTFRLVFNHYFGTNYPLLPDTSYAYDDFKHIYQFFDVTDRAAGNAP